MDLNAKLLEVLGRLLTAGENDDRAAILYELAAIMEFLAAQNGAFDGSPVKADTVLSNKTYAERFDPQVLEDMDSQPEADLKSTLAGACAFMVQAKNLKGQFKLANARDSFIFQFCPSWMALHKKWTGSDSVGSVLFSDALPQYLKDLAAPYSQQSEAQVNTNTASSSETQSDSTSTESASTDSSGS